MQTIIARIVGSQWALMIFLKLFSRFASNFGKIFRLKMLPFLCKKQLIAKKKQVFANNHLNQDFFRSQSFQNLLRLCYKYSQSLGLIVILNL